jgi:hypothetical protein
MAASRSEAAHNRRRSITEPEASPNLASLSLAELRGYRRRLTAEEERISYWRRLVHARMDLLEAESRAGGALRLEDVVRALGETGTGQSRRALLRVDAADPLPELPVLTQMWVEEVDTADPAAVDSALESLRDAEAQLTRYRHALHQRIDEATGELIVRYRENPTSALSALPEA